MIPKLIIPETFPNPNKEKNSLFLRLFFNSVKRSLLGNKK